MKKIVLLTLAATFLFTSLAIAQDAVIGTWKTIDDETGEAKSHIEVYEKEGKLYGKVTKLLREAHVDDVCTACKDHRKGQKIWGMELMSGLSWDDDEYNGGEIMDPESGKVYSCKMWRDGDNLIVRGFIGFSLIGRQQTWLPVAVAAGE